MTQDNFTFLEKYFQEEHTELKRGDTSGKGTGAQQAATDGLQQFLQAEGYYTGKIDGLFGKGTQAAVKAFQEKHGMSPTGVVNESVFDEIVKVRAERARQKENPITPGDPNQEALADERLDVMRLGMIEHVEFAVNKDIGAVKRPVEGLGDIFHNMAVMTQVSTTQTPLDAKRGLLKNGYTMIGDTEISFSEDVMRHPEDLKRELEKLATALGGSADVDHDFDTLANGVALQAKVISKETRGK